MNKMFHKILILLLLLAIASQAGIRSRLSSPMNSAVSSIKSNTTTVMNNYIQEYKTMIKKMEENRGLYQQRNEKIQELHKRNKEVEVLLQKANFVYEQFKDIEALD